MVGQSEKDPGRGNIVKLPVITCVKVPAWSTWGLEPVWSVHCVDTTLLRVTSSVDVVVVIVAGVIWNDDGYSL